MPVRPSHRLVDPAERDLADENIGRQQDRSSTNVLQFQSYRASEPWVDEASRSMDEEKLATPGRLPLYPGIDIVWQLDPFDRFGQHAFALIDPNSSIPRLKMHVALSPDLYELSAKPEVD